MHAGAEPRNVEDEFLSEADLVEQQTRQGDRPMFRLESPAFREPTYAEPTYAEPTYAEPTHIEPTSAEPRHAAPMFGQQATADKLTADRPIALVIVVSLVCAASVGFLVARYAVPAATPATPATPVSAASPTPNPSLQPAPIESPAPVVTPRIADAGRGSVSGRVAAAKPIVPSSDSLSGAWAMTLRVESTTGSGLEDLNQGYRLDLTQDGTQIRGTGEKWMENGRAIPRAERTTLTATGTVSDAQVTLTVMDKGPAGATLSTFTYAIARPGLLVGSFSSDITGVQGSAQARREPGALPRP